MASASFRFLVELSLLEGARPDLLLAFLKPYRRALAGLGVAVEGSLYSADWLAQLHHVLNSSVAAVPAPLQAALMDIADLSTALGHQLIVAQAIERGVNLAADGNPVVWQDLAFHAYLFHRDLFRAAHIRLQSMHPTDFVEFYGRG